MSAPSVRRRRASSIAAEAAFRERITEAGGRVVGPWVSLSTPVDCVCPEGHPCRPRPSNIRHGQGLCKVCGDRAGADAKLSKTERAFRARVAELGGTVVGVYGGYDAPVECLCPVGHSCSPLPTGLRQGEGMCRRCGHNKRARAQSWPAEQAFHQRVTHRGGRVVGQYVNDSTPVSCVCPKGHPCRPRPGVIQRGQGMCVQCAGKDWDVLYVVTNPSDGRIKFGITSGDPRPRLANHRRAGYDEVVRLIADLSAAAELERNILHTLRDAGILPVQGREYYDRSALPVVLDIVDGWTSLQTAATEAVA